MGIGGGRVVFLVLGLVDRVGVLFLAFVVNEVVLDKSFSVFEFRFLFC